MPPINDDFANRITLTGDSGTWTGANAGASVEASEPAPFAGTGGASIWFAWTPGFTGLAQIDTIGSVYTGTADPLDTVVDVFTGSTLAGLILVDGNDDDPSGLNGFNSRLRTAVTSGTTYVVRVDGYGGDTGDIALHWAQRLAPNITGFDPADGDGGPGDALTIFGSSFTAATDVTFDGVSLTFTVVDDGHITTTVPGGAALDTTHTVAVTNGSGTDSAAWRIQHPFVSSVSPTHGAPGTLVTATGIMLASVDEVQFQVGGTTVSVAPASVSEHTVTAVVPVMAGGAGLIELDEATVFIGNASFTVDAIPVPTIASVLPSSGAVGATVVIAGAGFFTATSVDFDGAAAVFTVDSDTQITAVVPEGASSGPVTVTNPAGSASTSFVVTVAPPSGSLGFVGSDRFAGGSTSVTLDVPGSVEDGDLVVVAVLQDHSATGTASLAITPPAAFSALTFFMGMWLGYAFWHTGDATALTFTTVEDAAGVLLCFRGVDPSVVPDSAIRGGVAVTDDNLEGPLFVESDELANPHRRYLHIDAGMVYGQGTGLVPRAPLVSPTSLHTGTAGGGASAGFFVGKDLRVGYHLGETADGDSGRYYFDGVTTTSHVGESLAALFVSHARPGWSVSAALIG